MKLPAFPLNVHGNWFAKFSPTYQMLCWGVYI